MAGRDEPGLPFVEDLVATLRGLPEVGGLAAGAQRDLVAQLDDEAREIIGRFLVPGRRKPPQRLIAAARDLFGVLLDAYWRSRPIPAAGEDEWDVRLMRAAADRMVWECHAGGPRHPHLWERVGAVFDDALAKGRTAVVRLPPWQADTSVEREYRRILAYFAAGLNQVPPEAFGVVVRLVDLVLPSVEIGPACRAGGLLYHLPADRANPPRRLFRSAASEEGDSLSLARAHEALLSLEDMISVGETPETLLPFGGERLLPAVRHLLHQWSGSTPGRRYRRHLLGGQLVAVRGVHELRRLFSGEQSGGVAQWALHDVSRGGIGALVPESSAPLRFGELVGIRPQDGDRWHLAVVRRTWREMGGQSFVGLQTLSRRPVLASVDDGWGRMDVLLCDPVSRGEAVRVAAPLGMLRAGVPLYVVSNGSVQKLKPLDAATSGEGFELRVYQVL